ncbi:Fasciclin-like arabinogalactan protein 6 [Dionaea muscipula]
MHCRSLINTMANSFPLSVSLITLLVLTLLFSFCQCQGKSSAAAAAASPTSSAPANLTAILDKGGQFTTFTRLLTTTQVANQIENQLNNSNQGMTIFAPTDNAFDNLKAGTVNSLSTQQQVQLVLYHVLPEYYSLQTLQTVSNPVRTQASGQDGGVWGLNFTSLGTSQQVNVSTGVVETQINNALWEDFPLAVYPVDKVLLPEELSGEKTIALAPLPAKSNSTATKGGATASENTTSGSGGGCGTVRSNVGWCSVIGLWALICTGFLY